MSDDVPQGAEPGMYSATEDLLASRRGSALAADVEDYLAGRVWVTVWHGDIETDADQQRITALANKAETFHRQWPGSVVRRQSGNDYTATLFGPAGDAPPASDLADLWAAYAAEIAPTHSALANHTWWRITLTAPTAGPPSR